MTDETDIAYMRRLAEEASTVPMRGGSILMSAGLIYGLSSMAHWTVISGLISIDPQAFSLIWLGATLLFLGVLAIIIAGLKREGGVQTAANRASAVAWSSVGWGIFALFTSIAVVSMRIGEQSLVLLSLVPSIIMVFYGLGWAVTAAMMRTQSLWWLAIASFAAAPLLALLGGEPAQYLAYGVALFVLMALPGYLLMRQAKQA